MLLKIDSDFLVFIVGALSPLDNHVMSILGLNLLDCLLMQESIVFVDPVHASHVTSIQEIHS